MKLSVYKPEEIETVLAIMEHVQGLLEIEDPDILYDMIEEALNILDPEE